MFDYCENIFEKASVVFAIIGVFVLGFGAPLLLADFLNLDIIGCLIFQCIIAYFMNIFETVYKRKIITKCKEELRIRKLYE